VYSICIRLNYLYIQFGSPTVHLVRFISRSSHYHLITSLPFPIMSQPSSSDQFTRVGDNKQCFQYIEDAADEFKAWHETTEWFLTQQALEQKKKKTIRWGSTRRANGWECFMEGAARTSGVPKIICKRCDTVLTHPTIYGTTGMTEHVKSKNCKIVSNGRGHIQLTLKEGYRAQVLP
jgi:hypothetical protein